MEAFTPNQITLMIRLYGATHNTLVDIVHTIWPEFGDDHCDEMAIQAILSEVGNTDGKNYGRFVAKMASEGIGNRHWFD